MSAMPNRPPRRSGLAAPPVTFSSADLAARSGRVGRPTSAPSRTVGPPGGRRIGVAGGCRVGRRMAVMRGSSELGSSVGGLGRSFDRVRLVAEVGGGEAFADDGRVALVLDAAVQHDPGHVRDVEDVVAELLHQQDRNARVGDPADVVVQLARRRAGPGPSTARRSAAARGRWPGPGPGSASAARRPTAFRRSACDRSASRGNWVEGPLLDRGERRAGERGHAQVLEDRQVGEDPATLGDEAHADAGDGIRGRPGDVVTRPATTLPAWGAIWPLATPSVVVLPAPFGPSSAYTSPAAHGEVHAVQHVDVAVAGPDLAELEHR